MVSIMQMGGVSL